MTTQLPCRERLAEIHKLAAKSDKYIYHLRADEVEAMARFALAAHEQEPVAYIDPFSLQNFETYRAGETNNKRMGREWMWAKPDAGLMPVFTHPAPVPAVPELVSIIGELTSAIRSINRAPHHIAKGVDDDEPCYWQRKEWIDWILELASSADEKSRAAMLNGGKS